MTSQYNRLLYDNYCLQYHCSQLTTRISVLEMKIQTLESKIQTLESKIQTMESTIHSITENMSNNPPIYSRKSRNKPATFSMNQYNPIVLPQTRPIIHKKPPITHEPEQYSSLTEDSDA
jgi:peptidoglycan hydrolase CwlO-like protein